ncbi:metal-sulfur cluster assembly factor [Haloarchaeobius sp. HME9146]|uniref:metal-sulfur cluster assembly factor n=1 Tax=Haloarchaeobius sp. HME9146 TaxID=2978732 RepID=UPI0021BF02A1|nr:iron-sulfur cluster assembly protein [Haloarchaeobius sp. HME9146]MCT9098103.1 iron-sulfur cluster assembly protein [Haloarchaeobius sp. HME9146]
MSMSSHITPETEFDDDLKSAIKAELDEVLDPCSCASNHPISILDLGLVEGIETRDGGRHVEVTLLLTSQLCTYFIDMNDEIIERVEALDPVEEVIVHQDTSGQIWTKERMSEDERKTRRERFLQRMDDAGVTPYAERTS